MRQMRRCVNKRQVYRDEVRIYSDYHLPEPGRDSLPLINSVEYWIRVADVGLRKKNILLKMK